MLAGAALERFGERDLEFINWRSCRCCLKNEWTLIITILLFFVFCLQVNLFQKPSFLHQLIHNMTRDCSLNSPKNTSSEHVLYKNCCCFLFCFDIQNNICTQHVLNLYFRGIQFNSYCGLTDSRRSASDTDLPLTVQTKSAKCNCVQNSFNTWTETTKATTFICSWPLSECVGFWYMKKGRIKNT